MIRPFLSWLSEPVSAPAEASPNHAPSQSKPGRKRKKAGLIARRNVSKLPSTFRTRKGTLSLPSRSRPKRPSSKMVRLARRGRLTGFLEKGVIVSAKEFGEKANPATARIRLNKDFDFETDHLSDESESMDVEERNPDNLFYISLGDSELPSYHFWKGPEDVDPIENQKPFDWDAYFNRIFPQGKTEAHADVEEPWRQLIKNNNKFEGNNIWNHEKNDSRLSKIVTTESELEYSLPLDNAVDGVANGLDFERGDARYYTDRSSFATENEVDGPDYGGMQTVVDSSELSGLDQSLSNGGSVHRKRKRHTAPDFVESRAPSSGRSSSSSGQAYYDRLIRSLPKDAILRNPRNLAEKTQSQTKHRVLLHSMKGGLYLKDDAFETFVCTAGKLLGIPKIPTVEEFWIYIYDPTSGYEDKYWISKATGLATFDKDVKPTFKSPVAEYRLRRKEVEDEENMEYFFPELTGPWVKLVNNDIGYVWIKPDYQNGPIGQRAIADFIGNLVRFLFPRSTRRYLFEMKSSNRAVQLNTMNEFSSIQRMLKSFISAIPKSDEQPAPEISITPMEPGNVDKTQSKITSGPEIVVSGKPPAKVEIPKPKAPMEAPKNVPRVLEPGKNQKEDAQARGVPRVPVPPSAAPGPAYAGQTQRMPSLAAGLRQASQRSKVGIQSRMSIPKYASSMERTITGGPRLPTLYARLPTASEIVQLERRLVRAENELLQREESCRVCDKTTPHGAPAMREHYQEHKDERVQFCPLCEINWTEWSMERRREHLIVVHSLNSIRIRNGVPAQQSANAPSRSAPGANDQPAQQSHGPQGPPQPQCCDYVERCRVYIGGMTQQEIQEHYKSHHKPFVQLPVKTAVSASAQPPAESVLPVPSQAASQTTTQTTAQQADHPTAQPSSQLPTGAPIPARAPAPVPAPVPAPIPAAAPVPARAPAPPQAAEQRPAQVPAAPQAQAPAPAPPKRPIKEAKGVRGKTPAPEMKPAAKKTAVKTGSSSPRKRITETPAYYNSEGEISHSPTPEPAPKKSKKMYLHCPSCFTNINSLSGQRKKKHADGCQVKVEDFIRLDVEEGKRRKKKKQKPGDPSGPEANYVPPREEEADEEIQAQLEEGDLEVAGQNPEGKGDGGRSKARK